MTSIFDRARLIRRRVCGRGAAGAGDHRRRDARIWCRGSPGSSTREKFRRPMANTLYFVHLPGSVADLVRRGGTTCSDNCAYHFFYTKGGKEVRYAVIPDQNSGACSTNQRVPDAIGGVRSTDHRRVARAGRGGHRSERHGLDRQQSGVRRDRRHLRRASRARPRRFTVQLEWSNKLGKCIDHDPTSCSTTSGWRWRRRA